MSLDLAPEAFRQLAERVVQLAADHLATLDGRPIQARLTGEELVQRLGGDAPELGCGEGVIELLGRVVDGARAQNGRFLGYVMGSGEPVGAAADLLASVLNQNLTAWRSSPAGVTVERSVVRWLAGAVGCAGFSGSLTGGGSSANLMALAMAREALAPANEAGGAAGTVYASEQVHMSIGKAVALLGLGREQLRLVPTDDRFRMRVDELERAVARDRAAGRTPIAVVATAGTVATGSIDPLARIAAVARRERLWLHVDGAFGALAAMVAPERFEGLALADSLSLDAHKWLYQAVDCGCLLYTGPGRRAAGVHAHGRLHAIVHGRSARGLRVLRGVDGALAPLPGAPALDVHPLPRDGGLPRRDPGRPRARRAARGADRPRARAGAARARRAERRLLPAPVRGGAGRPEHRAPRRGEPARARLPVERDDPRRLRAARLLREPPDDRRGRRPRGGRGLRRRPRARLRHPFTEGKRLSARQPRCGVRGGARPASSGGRMAVALRLA